MSSRPKTGTSPDRSSTASEPAPEVFTGTLLLHAFQGFERMLFDGYRQHGEDALRPKHGAVIANIDSAGTRPSVLAARAGMTRPAMGELIDELEAAGYVERVPDPADRRAKLIKPTERTIRRQRLAKRVNAKIEAGYQKHLGEAQYAELRQTLAQLVALTGSGAEISQPPANADRRGDRRGHPKATPFR